MGSCRRRRRSRRRVERALVGEHRHEGVQESRGGGQGLDRQAPSSLCDLPPAPRSLPRAQGRLTHGDDFHFDIGQVVPDHLFKKDTTGFGHTRTISVVLGLRLRSDTRAAAPPATPITALRGAPNAPGVVPRPGQSRRRAWGEGTQPLSPIASRTPHHEGCIRAGRCCIRPVRPVAVRGARRRAGQPRGVPVGGDLALRVDGRRAVPAVRTPGLRRCSARSWCGRDAGRTATYSPGCGARRVRTACS